MTTLQERAEELTHSLLSVYQMHYARFHCEERIGVIKADELAKQQVAKFILPALQSVARETLEAAAQECNCHADFCKDEAHKGGNFEHLMTRRDEAVYLMERILALTDTRVAQATRFIRSPHRKMYSDETTSSPSPTLPHERRRNEPSSGQR